MIRSFTTLWIVTALSVCPLSGGLSALAGEKPVDRFRPRRVLPRKKPISDAPVVSAADVGEKLEDNELVLGVVVNGEARAYAINMLTGPSREIINDVLGEVPIAATWCHLCHNTMVYDRRLDDRTLTFAVSGMLWQRNLVMIDSETDTLWSHFLGRAMRGPLEGSRLESFPSELTTWGKWRQEHPETSALMMSRHSRQYVREFYERPEDFVFGIVIDDEAHHAVFSELLETPIANMRLSETDLLLTFDVDSPAAQLFDRTVDDTMLTFSPLQEGRMTDVQTGSVWDRHTGVAVEGPMQGKSLHRRVGMPAYRKSWMAFHPESQLINAKQDDSDE